MDIQDILSRARRAVEDYDMIRSGDSVAVGVSGGKDSLMTLEALAGLRRFLQIDFSLRAISLDLGSGGMTFEPIAELCAKLDVPYEVVKTDIKQIVFDIRKEENPCSLCAKMRRGALNSAAKASGCGVVALGHHLDDAVETFLLSLIYEGRLSCFTPRTYLDRSDITVIRPLIYCREYEIAAVAKKLELPIVKNTCPEDGKSKRARVKELAEVLRGERADMYEKIFGSIQRLPLPGWEKIK